MLFEVVEPFFSLRLHPNTSLRECVRPSGQPSGSAYGPGTEDSFATVSRGMAVSISLTLRLRGGVQVAPQTGLAGEGLFRKGRADATVILSFCVVRSVRRDKARQVNISVRRGRRFLITLTSRRGLRPRNGGEGRGTRGRGLVPLVAGTKPAKLPHGGFRLTVHLRSPRTQAPAWAHAVFRCSFCRGGPPTWYA